MTSRADGYFEAYINQVAQRLTSDEKAVMRSISETVSRVIPRSQVRWAGSQRKKTSTSASSRPIP